MMTSLSSLGSRSTIASRISSSSSARRSRAVVSISRSSGSSPSSASSSCAPAASSVAWRHSSASFAAGSRRRYSRPTSAYRWRSPITSGSDMACDSSVKRASICPTSPSITAARVSPPDLGDDLDADELLGGVLARRLDREHRVHGGDRDGELLVVRLTRGELLQHQAGPHDRADPALAPVAPRELDDLERDAGDERHAEDAREHEPVPRRQADRREQEDRDDHDDEQEARPAAGVQPREALRVLRRQRKVRLVAGDRLVLGAVVLEDAAQVAQAGEQRDVAEEDRRAQDALDQPEQQRRAELILDEARESDGHDEEQADREQQRDDHRAEPHAARDLLLLLGQLRVGRDTERLEADRHRLDERDDAADDRQAQRAVALQHRGQRKRLDLDVAAGGLLGVEPLALHLLGQRLADGDGPGRDAAHHHALEDGLAAHGSVALGPELAGLLAGRVALDDVSRR